MTERFEDALGETENAYALVARSGLEDNGRTAGRECAGAAHVEDSGLVGVILLSGSLKDDSIRRIAVERLNMDVPVPGRAVEAEGRTLLRLGASEFVVLTAYEEAFRLCDALQSELAARSEAAAMCAEASDGYCALRISGSGSRDALAKGVQADLHPDAFGAGSVMRANIGAVSVLLHASPCDPTCASDAIVFNVLAPRSQARALFDWLIRASRDDCAPGAIPDR